MYPILVQIKYNVFYSDDNALKTMVKPVILVNQDHGKFYDYDLSMYVYFSEKCISLNKKI